MQWKATLIGDRAVYHRTESSPGAKAFFVALVASFMYHAATDALPEVTSPKIKTLTLSMPYASSGKPLKMSCTADPGYPADFTLIYWLVNNTFVEMLQPRGRISETEELESTCSSGAILQRDLLLSVVQPEDFSIPYTCAVLSPVGTDSKTIHLKTLHRRHANKRQKKGRKKSVAKI